MMINDNESWSVTWNMDQNYTSICNYRQIIILSSYSTTTTTTTTTYVVSSTYIYQYQYQYQLVLVVINFFSPPPYTTLAHVRLARRLLPITGAMNNHDDCCGYTRTYTTHILALITATQIYQNTFYFILSLIANSSLNRTKITKKVSAVQKIKIMF